jgi:hypothetical protein
MTDMRKGTCPLCGCVDIMQAIGLQLISDGQGGIADYPDGVTYSRDFSITLGQIERYICRACGFIQSFAQDPQDIPATGMVRPYKPR